MPRLLAGLEALAGANAAEAGLAADIRATATEKLTELAETVRREKAGDHAGALDLVRTNFGQRTMDRMRSLTARLQGAQQTVLARQIAMVRDGGNLLVAIDAAGLVLILLLAGVIGWSTRRAVLALRAAQSELSAANAELAGVNDRLEASVAERTADLTAANEEIQRFAYIVSHDLRSPLVNIMGFTSELETATMSLTRFVTEASARMDARDTAEVRASVTEDLPEAIRFIKSSTAKMDRLIAAILRLSREGRRVPRPEPVELRPLALGIVESLAHQLAERDATIELGALPDLVTDRLAIEQILSNLLENAVKYLKPGRPGRIVLRGRTLGRFALLDVEDNGRGIASRDLDRIFDLFRRAGDQTVPGEGIGLAHVRALTRRLGGKVDCESVPDVGSTFRIRLPLVPDETRTEQRPGSGQTER
jgi:signal transduction histidine kinase